MDTYIYYFIRDKKFFSNEQEIINYLRYLGDEEFNNASDEFILNESHSLEEWEIVESNSIKSNSGLFGI